MKYSGQALLTTFALTMSALAAPHSSFAQESAPPEFWSSSYQRFQRTQSKTMPSYETAGAHFIAPLGVLICDPRNLGGSAQADSENEPAVVTTAFGSSADFTRP